MEGAEHAGLERVDRVALVLRRRGGAGEVEDGVGRQPAPDDSAAGLGDVVDQDREARVRPQVLDVGGAPGLEVVEADHAAAAGEQRLAQMRADEARAAGDQDGPGLAALRHAELLPLAAPAAGTVCCRPARAAAASSRCCLQLARPRRGGVRGQHALARAAAPIARRRSSGQSRKVRRTSSAVSARRISSPGRNRDSSPSQASLMIGTPQAAASNSRTLGDQPAAHHVGAGDVQREALGGVEGRVLARAAGARRARRWPASRRPAGYCGAGDDEAPCRRSAAPARAAARSSVGLAVGAVGAEVAEVPARLAARAAGRASGSTEQ